MSHQQPNNTISLPSDWDIPKQECFSYAELKSITIKECGEKLVDLNSIPNLQLKVGPTPEKLKEYVSHGMWVRESVARQLQIAQQIIAQQEPNYKILVRYAYRHPEVQKKYFNDFYNKSKIEHPNFSEDELLEYVHHYMAIPEVGGHPAGAAIDILLVDDSTGDQVDMGSFIADFTDMSKVKVFSQTITKQQLNNRVLLRKSMMQAGFAPYDFEWWHFSYGDREWACYYKNDFAIYGEVDFRI
jgi:D-alanyl-D-alanine dipeptidase